MIARLIIFMASVAGGFCLVGAAIAFLEAMPDWWVLAAVGAVFEAVAVLMAVQVNRKPPRPPLPVAPVGSRVVIQPASGRVSVASPPTDLVSVDAHNRANQEPR